LRQRIVDRVAALPGVSSVGTATNMHLNALNTSSAGVTIDGVEPPPGRLTHEVDATQIDTGFVAAAGLRLVEGRNFVASDAEGPLVAMVNAAFAERFWPGASAVGRVFRRGQDDEMVEYQVVGVVATAKIRSLAEDPRPFAYLPIMRRESSMFWLVARTAGPADVVAAALLPAIREVDPDVFAIRAGTMEQHLAVMSLPMKLGAVALAAFALLALVMASVGLYGTVSYAVSQRSREVGIRLSLGADGGSVTRLLLWSGLRLVVIGAAVGLVLAFVLARLLEGLLLGVAALDPLTFAAVPVVLMAVAVLAAWVPARRAGRADPIAALRAE
jgi:predicted permease